MSSSVPLHVLEKLWAVSRVLVFACRTPQHVFTLALVNRAFLECALEYNVGASILDRIFDARNKWQSEDDVKTVWLQVAAIMKAEQNVESFDPELLAQMEAAMRQENQRALIEYDASQAVEDDPVGGGLVATHRLAQSLGSLCVAFRGSGRNIDWFGQADIEVNKRAEKDADFSIRVSPSLDYDDAFSVLLLWRTQLVGFSYIYQPRIDSLDVSFLPSTLINAIFRGTDMSAFDTSGFLVQLQQACPRLQTLNLGCCKGLTFQLSFAALARFPDLTSAEFYSTDVWSEPLDFDELPPETRLTWLDVSHTRVSSTVTGKKPAGFTMEPWY